MLIFFYRRVIKIKNSPDEFLYFFGLRQNDFTKFCLKTDRNVVWVNPEFTVKMADFLQKGGNVIFKKKWFKRIVIMVLTLLYFFVVENKLILAQGRAGTDAIDVVFIMDTSYSMNETDKNRISVEMLKLFTDLHYAKQTRVGFVAYNDVIEGIKPLTEVTTDKAKEEFKRSLDAVERFGRTDTGLGLKKGWELIQNSDDDRQSFIVLLTDGEIDIDPMKSQRTVDDSIRDTKDIVTRAAAKKIPIYTIAMGNQSVDLALLQDIAEQTNAENYIANTPQDLLEIFNAIFASASHARFAPVATVRPTDQIQELNITLPNKHIAEANIVFLSSATLRDTQVFYNSKNVSFYNTQYYSTVKIINPEQSDAKIRFRGIQDDVVKINMLLRYDIKSEVNIDGKLQSGQPVKLQADFIDTNHEQRIVDKSFYHTFTAKAMIKNLDTEEVTEIPMQVAENGWEAEYTFSDDGRYSYCVEIDNQFYNEITKTLDVNVEPAVAWGKIIVSALIVILLILIYYREKRTQPVFTGKINAYYLKLKHTEDGEIPPIMIGLKEYGQKKINLFEILHTLHADQGLVEGEKIWFQAGEDKTIVLMHNSACTILVGQLLLCKKKKQILHYGDKIYITYPDNAAEIELHYKGVKSTETFTS